MFRKVLPKKIPELRIRFKSPVKLLQYALNGPLIWVGSSALIERVHPVKPNVFAGFQINIHKRLGRLRGVRIDFNAVNDTVEIAPINRIKK